jgi:xanthosine utilization system XapX-like protein
MAWLLPLFAGTGVCWLAAPARGHLSVRLAVSMGGGWIVGVLMAAWLARWTARTDTAHAFAHAAPWLVALGILAWAPNAVRLWRYGRSAVSGEGNRPSTRIARGFWWLLLALIVSRLLLVGDEAALRPVFPWDAWSTWALKPKAWLLLGQADTYVPMSDWLSDPQAPMRTTGAWNYPELLAWVQIWFASSAGDWNEPLVDVAWCGALAAFALAAYGYWRSLELSAGLAMGLVYALVSLPLIDAHIALAGYADLWIAVTLGLAMLAWSRWLIHREERQWGLAVALALCLPAIKLEGAIWLLEFLAMLMLDLLPARWRWRVVGGMVVVVLIGLSFGGFSLPIPGLGWTRLAWGSLTISSSAIYHLAWHPVGEAMLASLFTLPNWHLLWYVFPVLVAVRWRVLLHDHAARMLGGLVFLQFVFLFVLFFLTDAAMWAEDFTSANRLILHIVPSVFVFSAVLMRGALADTQPTQAAQGQTTGVADQ